MACPVPGDLAEGMSTGRSDPEHRLDQRGHRPARRRTGGSAAPCPAGSTEPLIQGSAEQMSWPWLAFHTSTYVEPDAVGRRPHGLGEGPVDLLEVGVVTGREGQLAAHVVGRDDLRVADGQHLRLRGARVHLVEHGGQALLRSASSACSSASVPPTREGLRARRPGRVRRAQSSGTSRSASGRPARRCRRAPRSPADVSLVSAVCWGGTSAYCAVRERLGLGPAAGAVRELGVQRLRHERGVVVVGAEAAVGHVGHRDQRARRSRSHPGRRTSGTGWTRADEPRPTRSRRCCARPRPTARRQGQQQCEGHQEHAGRGGPAATLSSERLGLCGMVLPSGQHDASGRDGHRLAAAPTRRRGARAAAVAPSTSCATDVRDRHRRQQRARQRRADDHGVVEARARWRAPSPAARPGARRSRWPRRRPTRPRRGRAARATTPTDGAGTTSSRPRPSRTRPPTLPRDGVPAEPGEQRRREGGEPEDPGRDAVPRLVGAPAAQGQRDQGQGDQADREVDHGHGADRASSGRGPASAVRAEILAAGSSGRAGRGDPHREEQRRGEDHQDHRQPRDRRHAGGRVQQHAPDRRAHDEGAHLDGDQQVGRPSALPAGEARHRRDQGRVGRGGDGDGEPGRDDRRPHVPG